MNPVAIRTVITGIVAVLTGLGLIPESTSTLIEEHATTAVASILALWSIVAGLRWRKELGKRP